LSQIRADNSVLALCSRLLLRRVLSRSRGSGEGEKVRLAEPGEVKTDERDEEDVGIQVAMEREASEGNQRHSEAQHQHAGAKRQEAQLPGQAK